MKKIFKKKGTADCIEFKSGREDLKMVKERLGSNYDIIEIDETTEGYRVGDNVLKKYSLEKDRQKTIAINKQRQQELEREKQLLREKWQELKVKLNLTNEDAKNLRAIMRRDID